LSRLEHLKRQRPPIIAATLYRLIRLIGGTCRVRVEGMEHIADPSKKIMAGWHGKSLLFANYFRDRGFWVIISNSNDGDMQADIFERLGYQTIRGSTGRGGERALIKSLKALRDGGTMALTPDGPRGPSQKVQGGVMLMAQKTGAGLIPTGISAKPAYRAKSWDRYMLPAPFGKGIIIFGEPIYVPADADEAEVERCRLQLENEINRLEALAEERL
jgi:lysophospholipid acyltransferase (LPLAT)-like uncharacterized protein